VRDDSNDYRCQQDETDRMQQDDAHIRAKVSPGRKDCRWIEQWGQ
jgi:hypothetical protein